MRIELSGVRSSCDMLARNSDLYFEVSASSSAFSSSARRACSTSVFLRSTSAFCSASSLAFLRQLLVGLLEFGLPRLQFDRELLRLLSSPSVRIVASMVLSTTPMLWVSCSRKAR